MSALAPSNSSPMDAPVRIDEREREKSFEELGELVAPLGREIVEISGDLDSVRAQAVEKAESMSDLAARSIEAKESTAKVTAAAEATLSSTRMAIDSVASSREQVADAGGKSKQLATWAQSVGQRFETLRETLVKVEREAEEIGRIAQQVNILAINASIEAVRAGERGRGFAVVASAINDLAATTAQTTGRIASNLQVLKAHATEMISEGQEAHVKAVSVIEGSEKISTAVLKVEEIVGEIDGRAAEIVREAASIDQSYEGVVSGIRHIESRLATSAKAVDMAGERLGRLVDTSESLVAVTSELGCVGEDAKFISRVIEMASEIGRRFEAGVAAGRISEQALFDQRYRPIAGSNPEQVMAPFTEFTDRVLPEIQEAALKLDDKVVFCAAVDRNGYLPTHNLKFSQPQGADPVWNAANCRNRRIFDDRVGLKAGKNTKKFLLQTYRRDMGDCFVMMKDLSAPILVNGRHWGGLRFAYKF